MLYRYTKCQKLAILISQKSPEHLCFHGNSPPPSHKANRASYVTCCGEGCEASIYVALALDPSRTFFPGELL